MKNRNESSEIVSALPTDIGCRKAQALMSPFIDSMARNDEVGGLEAHLEQCEPCQRQLQGYVSVKNLLRSVEEPPVPEDLALETRVRLSHERVPSSLHRVFARAEVWASNVIRPLAVPAIAGICSTLLLFGFVLENLSDYRRVPVVGPPFTRIEVTEPTLIRLDRSPPDLRLQAMFVEVGVDVDGKVTDYTVLSGPLNDPVVDIWLDNLLFAAVFRPATRDGRPFFSKQIMSLPGVFIGVDVS